MTPRQKRAYNRAVHALADLAKVSATDGEAFNRALQLVMHTAGVMIGGSAAMLSLDLDEVHAATVRASRHMQDIAARAYGEGLARQKAAAGRPS
jgi:hypothetical protein